MAGVVATHAAAQKDGPPHRGGEATDPGSGAAAPGSGVAGQATEPGSDPTGHRSVAAGPGADIGVVLRRGCTTSILLASYTILRALV